MTQSALARLPLSVEHTTFVDRRGPLAEARALLGKTRLLTVSGPGGVGKSRFTLQLVNAVRRLFDDQVWFFDLSSVRTGGSVADHVATKLGLQSASRDQVGEIAAYFGQGRGLVVLDSCEHGIDLAAELVRKILAECPGISIIATSQAVFRMSAEVVFPLGPLLMPDDRTPLEASAV
ncbi:MAG: NB-ARC domain-containing protein, partial [Leifsonia sp.]